MRTFLKILMGPWVVLALGCGGKQSAGTTPAVAAAINNCTAYKDMTDAGANSIPWNETISTSEMRCIKIKVGGTVGFTGNFTKHPMKSANGTIPNPFDSALTNVSNPGAADEQTNVEFTAVGTFGYTCTTHPAMTGAVLVIP